MPTVVLALEDLPDGTLRVSMDSDPPLQFPLSTAQCHMVALHEFLLNQTGAPVSEAVPVEVVGLLETYKVAPFKA